MEYFKTNIFIKNVLYIKSLFQRIRQMDNANTNIISPAYYKCENFVCPFERVNIILT